jgi:hypothetical protein
MVDKRSVSLDDKVAKQIDLAAAEDGMSFSTWLSRAAERELHIRGGLRGVAEWESEAGALTQEERAAGETLLNRLLAEKQSGNAVAS